MLEPAALKGGLQWWEGFIGDDGEFAIDPEKQGTPAIVAFQEISGETTSLALEIRGCDVGRKDQAYRKKLLQSALKATLLKLGLEQPHRGRPHDANRSESIAYSRDHQRLTKQKIATQFCNCGNKWHIRLCFDRLDALADGFYSVQRSRFEKLVKRQRRFNS